MPPQFDLKNPDLYQDEGCHRVFAHLRAHDPVYWNPEADGAGFWAVTRYDDVLAVSKNPELFSSARAQGGHRIFDELDVGDPSLDASMISMDPPEHAAYRRMVTPGFTPQRIAQMEARVRARVTEILDRIQGEREVEFIATVAAELPIQVLAELFGVPQEDRAKLFEWSNAVIGEDDPELRSSHAYIEACYKEMALYSLHLWQKRLQEPGDDLISMLAHAKVGGEPMSMQRYLSTFILLVVAGNETTRNSISGGVLALSQNAEQRRLLAQRPDLIANAVPEIVRYVSPVLHMRRTATADTELGGKTIRAGDKIVVWYASANRDESHFQDADRFDVTRGNASDQLGFGIGQHFCLGSRLAELQLRVMFEELLRRFPTLHAEGPVRRVRTNFLNSIKEMRVVLTPAASRAAA
ncbi:MAG: cytochrome P450 [Alphaproteobacteria bacterium]|nr:cytochrome P450 [Alphaproteobacteria bacterium]